MYQGYIDRAIIIFNNMLNSTYGLVGSFIIMYGMSPKLTIALLPIIPYIIIVSAVVGHFTQKTQYGVQKQFSGLTAFFSERRLIQKTASEHHILVFVSNAQQQHRQVVWIIRWGGDKY